LLAPDFDAHLSDEGSGRQLPAHAPPLSSPLELEGAAFALLSSSMRALVQQLADRLNQLSAAQSAANEVAQAQRVVDEQRLDSITAALSVMRDEVALLRWQVEQQQEAQQDAIYKLQLELFELRAGRVSADPQRPLPPPAPSRRVSTAAANSATVAVARHAVAEPLASEHKQLEQSNGAIHVEEERKQASVRQAAQLEQ
jgi:hypothetical protein